jgi:hypothetical protein
VETVRSILDCPLVPADWFTRDCRQVANAAVQLDRVTRAYRQQLPALPEFAPDAARQQDADLPLLAAQLAKGSRHIPRVTDSVRTMPQRLAAAGQVLAELGRRAATVDRAAKAVQTLLGLPTQPVKALRRLAELADHVARMGPVRRGWWDAARRKELQAVAQRCQEEPRAAQEARADLAARLSPRAFAPEAAPLVAEAIGYRSFFTRLFPRWWSVKARVAAWFPGKAPPTATLLDTLRELAEYHRRVDFCQQAQEQYEADLLTTAEGEPDWERSLGELQALDRLGQLIKDPTLLRPVLTHADALDRPALRAAADVLAKQVAALRTQLEAAASEYDLGEVAEDAPTHVRLSPGALATWADEQAALLAQQADLFRTAGRLLAPGHDVPAADVPAKLQAVTQLAILGSEVATLGAVLWPGNASPAAESQDWSGLCRTAEALLRLLDRWSGTLPAPVVRALADEQVRSQLAEAVRQSDAAQADGFEESSQFLGGLFDLAQEVSTGITIDTAPLSDLCQWFADRINDVHRLYEWIRYCEVEREVGRAGLSRVLTEVRGGQVKTEEASAAFRARFLRLWLDAVYEQVPALRQFETEGHERLVERFRELDRRAVASAAARIRVAQLSRPDRPRLLEGAVPSSSELGTLLREVNKKRCHLALRKLFAAIPSLLPRLKPCLMMSPLAVSTYLHSPDFQFDLVIFDEASQVRPHDAICAIYRGRQLIVAGDQKQLPPTSFFDRGQEEHATDEAEDGGLEDYESVLDVCCTLGLPRRRLRWHYRSRREGLIAFANQCIYNNELVTFPSIHDTQGNPAVAFEYVAAGRWKAGASGGFNAVEARRTAELVLAHFRESPHESLGVIAFSQRQQLRILDELEQLRRDHPELEGYFGEGLDEPFFVKNLENVQGDERDVIFLGVGYGPDETGRVAMRFGPLNRQGGERRLNVAVTRARRRMSGGRGGALTTASPSFWGMSAATAGTRGWGRCGSGRRGGPTCGRWRRPWPWRPNH